ncbi:MAG: hypothetical protein HKN43_17325 [Rhodothermales bacterium]|nr:hypothetical protein [Rhodothermales bacterium]
MPVTEFHTDCLVAKPLREAAGFVRPDSLLIVIENPSPPEAGVPPVYSTNTIVEAWQSRFLYRVDCTGNRVPDLATSWSKADDGWLFDLLPTINADSVVFRLIDASVETNIAYFDTVYAIGSTKLFVGLNEIADEPPLTLGTFPFSLFTVDDGTNSSIGEAVIVVTNLGAQDARNLINGEAALLVSRDRSVIEYARSQSGYTVVGLPPDRVYALSYDITGEASGGPRSAPIALFENSVDEIIVQADDQYWWHESACPLRLNHTVEPGIQAKEILYHNDDPTARALATRLSLLPSLDSERNAEIRMFAESIPLFAAGGRPMVAKGVDHDQFKSNMTANKAAGYIIALTALPGFDCRHGSVLQSPALWNTYPLRSIVPLAASQPHIIVRKEIPVLIDYFGNLMLPTTSLATR